MIRAGRDMLLIEWADQLHLPGGGIDPGEGALSALHRECREETGWSIRVERRLGMFHSFTYATDLGAWVHKACQVYLARPALRIGPPSAPGHRAVWMPIDIAIDHLASGDASTFLRSKSGTTTTWVAIATP